jgi:hypothetical protein
MLLCTLVLLVRHEGDNSSTVYIFIVFTLKLIDYLLQEGITKFACNTSLELDMIVNKILVNKKRIKHIIPRYIVIILLRNAVPHWSCAIKFV